MKVAVISGVSGQDGAFLADLLIQKQYHVVGLVPHDRPSNLFRLMYLNVLEKVVLRPIDLLNGDDVKSMLKELCPDEFYNLSAISSVGLSFSQPAKSFDFNTRSTLNILEGLRICSPGTKFYQASSSEMFGSVGSSRLPIKESFLFHPVSPYGISKASAHWLTVNYREAFKLKTCCGILFNHESALRPPNFVIKKIIGTAIEIKQGTQTELSLGNVGIVRDWGYAPYYVDAMWRMLQQDTMKDYLICSGLPVSLNEIVMNVFGQLDLDYAKHVKTDPSLFRFLELDVIYGDNNKAKQELGWKYDLSVDELIQKLLSDEMDYRNWEKSLESKS